MENINIRRAGPDDCDFLSKIIVLAESTGAEIISYAKMFPQLPEEELRKTISKIISNDVGGFPLSYASYFIATVNEVPAAAVSGYIEGEKGDSNHLITGALLSGFGRADVISAFAFLKKHQDISIPKTIHTIQIDCVATLPEFRGRGLFAGIHEAIIDYAKNNGITESEIQVWKKNNNAIKTYSKLGYTISTEKISRQEQDNGKVLMKKNIWK